MIIPRVPRHRMAGMTLPDRRSVLLVQLPIPPLGPEPIRGNVPLAAAYLKLFAQRQGLDQYYDIAILPARQANVLGDRALVAALVERNPWLVGFSCYLWNIERSLWIARELKRRRPDVRIVLGGPEITADNSWLLETPDYDFAVIGEGEQTFSQFLLALLGSSKSAQPIPGLYAPSSIPGKRFDPARRPESRTPLGDLNQLGSPYLAGILDAADEEMLLLETARGCRYRCRFCYYWKSYDKTYYLPEDIIRGNLKHAVERGAREVFLLNPTLNQRSDFSELLGLLADCNQDRRFSYFGELRGEGVTEETARLLSAANFTEVEVGLQSIGPDAMKLMDRKNNLKAFERGVRAMRNQGIRVRADLIIGLPGDTVASVRTGLHYLHGLELGGSVQVFNLAVLPGTSFRQEAEALGLVHQPRPPYYVLNTPTMDRIDLFGLMQEAQQLFGIEYDAQPPPVLDFGPGGAERVWRLDLDSVEAIVAPPTDRPTQAFALWLRSSRFATHVAEATRAIQIILESNPFTTLQVVLEPAGSPSAQSIQNDLRPRLLDELMSVCLTYPTYLDKFYALQPGRPNGAKRLVVLLPLSFRKRFSLDWIETVGSYVTLVWQTRGHSSDDALEPHEYIWKTDCSTEQITSVNAELPALTTP
jgi:Radical SAM superfamily/B12 binding domain